MLAKLKAVNPPTSTWLTIGAGIAAVADAMQHAGNPQLALVGLMVAAVFKAVEGISAAYVSGKKLDVETQFVSTTAQTPPSVVTAAKAAGMGVVENPPVHMDAPAPLPQVPLP